MNGPEEGFGDRLHGLLEQAGMAQLDAQQTSRFSAYLSLILRWNSRTNLTSVRDPDNIVSRHFVECIACARALPEGIATLLDFGSGAGFPGIPIALCRPEIAVTLAESQGKKAAFLQEAVRTLGIEARVHCGRAETLEAAFDCVALRAVERMGAALTTAATLAGSKGWLAIMTTTDGLPGIWSAAGPDFSWTGAIPLPGSEHRLLALGRRLSFAA